MAQLQNIPSRNKPNQYDSRIQKLGPEIRESFEAPPGFKLVVCDLSQLELRLGAHFTHDPTLLGVYKELVDHAGFVFYTGDPHAETSRRMGVPRKLAKNLNFGLMYGMMAEAFARYAKIYKPGTLVYDVPVANEYVDTFHHTYSGVFAYHEKLRRMWWQGQRSFTTLSGRLRNFDGYDRIAAGKIYNSKIQGSAADVMKVQLWAFDRFVFNNPEFEGLRLIIQVHDEYLFEVPEEIALKCAVMIKFIMEWPFFQLDIPLLASAKICDTWGQSNDDSVPEVGKFYARVKDDMGQEVDLTFSPKTWDRYLKYEEDGRVIKKGAVAMLSEDQKSWARGFLPETPPEFTPQRGTRIISFEDFLKEKQDAAE